MKVASYLGKKKIEDQINIYFQNDKLPIELYSLSDTEEVQESYPVYIFTDLNESQERADRLLNKAKEVKGSNIIWLVTSDDSDWMDQAEESIRGENTILLTEKPNPTPEDIVDALVTLFDNYQETEEIPLEPEVKKTGALGSFEADKGFGRLSATLKKVKDSVPSMGRKKDEASSTDTIGNVETDIDLKDIHLNNVIAVSGHTGAGVSHVAWNIAAVIQHPTVLIEGGKTGALAAWLGRNSGGLSTRDQLFETGKGTQHTEYLDLALMSDMPLSIQDVIQLSNVDKIAVIDCGTDWDSEVFKRARVKVFVTAPDPQYVEHEKPESAGVKWVLNKWPIGSSIELAAVEQAFNRKFDLVVSQQMRHVMLASWTRKAAIELESDPEVIKSWRKMIGEELSSK